MRWLLSVLRRPLVWSGLGLLFLLLALSLVCDLLGFDEARWYVVLLVGVPLGLLWTGYWLRRYREDRRLTQDMASQAARQASQAGPDSTRDFLALQQEFKRAFQELNQECRERGLVGGAAALPWVLIMGPPAVGKSTALERSGLRFTSLGRRLQGIGATRNCTWWLTSDAVFLDTAGRYAVQEEDRQEWRAFLHLLKRRRRQPIDAVLLQVGLDELLDLSPSEVESHAVRLRERLDELLNILQVHIPVHLVFNKCDLLDGFMEFFSNLDADARSQAWGFTLDVESSAGQAIGKKFNEQIDALVAALSNRITARLLGQRERQALEAVICFPTEVSNLKDKLSRFAETLFEARGHRQQPRLVGVYLTSAHQTGIRLDGHRKRRADELGLSTIHPQPSAAPLGDTYFLRGVFQQVIRHAEHAARPSIHRLRMMRLNQYFAVALTMLGCGAGSWYLAERYRSDVQWLHRVQIGTEDLHSTVGIAQNPRRSREEVKAELAHQYAVLNELDARAQSGALSQPHRLATEFLRRRVIKQWLSPAADLMRQDLSHAANREQDDPGESFDQGYRVLKAIFILKGQRCPSVDPEDARQWISEYFVGQWQRMLKKPSWLEPGENDDDTRQPGAYDKLLGTLKFFFAQPLQQLPESTNGLHFDTAERTRAQEALVRGEKAAGVVFKLRASNANLYSRSPQLRTRQLGDSGIEQVFTKPGCNKFFGENGSGKEWWKCILGVEEPKEKLDLEDIYHQRYADAWNRWLHALRLRQDKNQSTPTDPLNLAVDTLGALIGESRPELTQALQIVGVGREERIDLSEVRRRRQQAIGCENKTLGRWETGARQAVKEMGTRKECRHAQEQLDPFLQMLPSKEKGSEGEPESGGLRELYGKYLEAARKFRLTLLNVRSSANNKRPAEALKLVQATMGATGDLWQLDVARRALIESAHGQLAGKGIDVRDSGLNRVLMEVEQNAWQALLPQAAEALDTQWKEKVYEPWRLLKEKHRRNDSKDPELVQPVIDFFNKELASFWRESLAPLYKRRCELAAMDEPFSQKLALRFSACDTILRAIDIGGTTDPNKAMGANGSAPTRNPVRADVAPPLNDRVCAEFVADRVTLDTGAKVFVCPMNIQTCSEQPGERSSQEPRLTVKWNNARQTETILKSDDYQQWIRSHLAGGSRLKFDIPSERAPSHCKGFVVTFDLAVGSGGGGPQKMDDRWKTIVLPQSLR